MSASPCEHCGGTGIEPPPPDPCVFVQGADRNKRCSRGTCGCRKAHARDPVRGGKETA